MIIWDPDIFALTPKSHHHSRFTSYNIILKQHNNGLGDIPDFAAKTGSQDEKIGRKLQK